MKLQQIYKWSRKIHRIAMWFCVLLAIPLVITGMIMENKELSIWVARMDWGDKVRWLHSEVSMKFVLAFVGMVVTGLLMWVIPKLIQNKINHE